MKKPNFKIVKSKNHNPVLFHGVLWSCSFIILLLVFSVNDTPKKIDLIYTSSFLVTLIFPVLINLYFLIPYFLKNEKYIGFAIAFVLNIIVFTQFNIWFFNYFIDYIFPDYYFISYHSGVTLIIFFSAFSILTLLIKLAEDWLFFNKFKNQELKRENQHIQSQLSTLRSQINPHFLFNSLNVIYALALEKQDKTTNAIVQLSDILRYVIYDSNTESVPLKSEILLLNNYIEFQKFRHKITENINFIYDVNNDYFPIYPMLLLPLLENSFKHGIMAELENTYINLKMTSDDQEFNFIIENNYDGEVKNTDLEHSGLGIDIIKKNLKIVYPERHVFAITKTKSKFIVSLKLFTNEN